MRSGALAPWLLLLAKAGGGNADCSADGDDDAADRNDGGRKRNAHRRQSNNDSTDRNDNRHCDSDPLRQHRRTKTRLMNDGNVIVDCGRGHRASVCCVDAIGG